MTEQQVKLIRDAVDLLFKGSDAGKLVNPDYFPSLVDDIRERLRTGSKNELPSEIELHCVTALCVLGPGGRGTPPEDMCKQLIQIVSEYANDHLERTLEFAIAYGCGKWREAESRSQGWPGLWSRAIDVMSLAMVHAVRDVNIWLGNQVHGYPDRSFWQSDEGRVMIAMDAKYLALRLINPVRSLHLGHNEEMQIQCVQDGAVYRMHGDRGNDEMIPAGARLVFSFSTPAELITQEDSASEEHRVLEAGTVMAILVRDDEIRITFPPSRQRITLKPNEHALIPGPADFERWECSCGNQNCAQSHRLDGWEPSERIKLWSFLASAVKGLKTLLTNSFKTTSYYPLLAMEGGVSATRVRSVPIEFKVCPNPNCTNPNKNKRYEGARCPHCKISIKPELVPRVADDLLIVVTDKQVYAPQKRQHCKGGEDTEGQKIECENLYTYSDPASPCPICGLIPLHPRPTTVWVRTFSPQSSDNDPDAIDRFSTGEEPSVLLEAEEAAEEFGNSVGMERKMHQKPQADRGEKGQGDD